MKSAVIVFPGSNCDRDVAVAIESVTGKKPAMVWHRATALPENTDLIVLPGGFSYGDYLRCGAMSAQSSIMRAVKAHAAKGGYVLGICNGFQILTESGLLPGVLMRNRNLKFICRDLHVRIEHNNNPFTGGYKKGEVVCFPVAHHDGCYFADPKTLKALNDNNQILFRYSDMKGLVDGATNPNGSLGNIAGITNKEGNVLGLMPHPERSSDPNTAGTDGHRLFESLLRRAA